MGPEDVPDDLAYRLRPAEQVLWWGRPERARLGIFDPAWIPAGAIAAAVLTAMIVVPRHWQPPVAMIFRWAIGFSALSLIVTHLTLVVRQRRLACYAVTRGRVLIVAGFWAGGMRAYARDALSGLRLDARPDGTGTIWFSGNGAAARPQFVDVAGAQAVFDLLRDGQRRG